MKRQSPRCALWKSLWVNAPSSRSNEVLSSCVERNHVDAIQKEKGLRQTIMEKKSLLKLPAVFK